MDINVVVCVHSRSPTYVKFLHFCAFHRAGPHGWCSFQVRGGSSGIFQLFYRGPDNRCHFSGLSEVEMHLHPVFIALGVVH